ncbi:MAG: hypothetical protein H7Z20_07980 [Bdellovibrio sp.]|nr:hypothetical protein [Methylotenera sp.]
MQKTIVFIKRYPFAMLLAVQLISILFYGVMTDSQLSHLIFNCLGLAVPILAVWTVYRTPATNWVSLVFAVIAIGITFISNYTNQSSLLIWAHIFESLLYFYAAASLVMMMFKDDIVTIDELFAAAATFTLLIWAFAFAYSVVQQIYPGSIVSSVNPGAPRTWIELIFSSFSMQSNTGIGDIFPVNGIGRAIGSCQIFFGVMYTAIVVSRLVGIAASTKNKR